ncbi:MAG: TIGR00341 family protein [Cyanobacteria bacterium J06638_6]
MQHNKRQSFLDRIRNSIPSSNLISDTQLVELEADLLEESRLSLNYIVLVIGAAGIATTGLISDSAAVIIGAMIIAPLMLPIRGTILGILTSNLTLIRRGTQSILVGTLLGIGIAFLLSSTIHFVSFGNEILSRTRPNTLDLVVALLAGATGTFAKCRPSIADSLAGVAIAVALMPPLCVVGIGLAKGDWLTSGGAFLLYLTNLIGIALACHVVFFTVGYSPSRAGSWLSQGAIGAFGWLVFLAFIMLAPLSASRLAFLQQDYFETLVTTILTEETETFEDATLLKSDFNWRTDPPSADLLVLSQDPFTSKQVRLLEQYIKDRTGQTVTLDVKVIPVL